MFIDVTRLPSYWVIDFWGIGVPTLSWRYIFTSSIFRCENVMQSMVVLYYMLYLYLSILFVKLDDGWNNVTFRTNRMYVCILLCIHYLKTLVLRTSVLIRLKISLTLICCKNDVVRSTFIFVHFSCLMEQCMWHWPRPDEQKVCFYCCVFNFEPFDCVGRSLRSYFCLAVFFFKM